MELNGDHRQQEKPTLTIVWDADKQAVGLGFDANAFKTWTFIIGLLEMAKNMAIQNEHMARMQAMAQQAEAQQLRKRLHGI
jgi:hypothetical protein